jgi:hypothetical protein
MRRIGHPPQCPGPIAQGKTHAEQCPGLTLHGWPHAEQCLSLTLHGWPHTERCRTYAAGCVPRAASCRPRTSRKITHAPHGLSLPPQNIDDAGQNFKKDTYNFGQIRKKITFDRQIIASLRECSGGVENI